MKKILAAAAITLAIVAYGNAASASEQVRFEGIDTSLSQHGYVVAEYKGEVYHLTEGDVLAGETVILIDATDKEVVVKDSSNALHEYRF